MKNWVYDLAQRKLGDETFFLHTSDHGAQWPFGKSFLPVLRQQRETHRDFILATHSGDGSNNVFPIRAARLPDGWKYIRNLHPEFRNTSHVTTSPGDSGYWDSWVDSATSIPEDRRRVLSYLQRPAEELYNVNDDPWEQQNLAADPLYADRLVTMRSTIDRWMVQTNDPQAVFGCPKYRAADGRPNILTVFIDDMGWSDLWSVLAGEDLYMSSP